MNNSHLSHENGIFKTGFRRVGSETVGAPRKPRATSQSAARKLNPHLPNQPVSERFPALEQQEIFFTFFAPEATDVNVAGNFNDWRTDAAPLKKAHDGKWAVRLMLRSGQYEYRFLVDGCWCEDPQAFQRTANPHGGFNSVLVVPLPVRMSLL